MECISPASQLGGFVADPGIHVACSVIGRHGPVRVHSGLLAAPATVAEPCHGSVVVAALLRPFQILGCRWSPFAAAAPRRRQEPLFLLGCCCCFLWCPPLGDVTIMSSDSRMSGRGSRHSHVRQSICRDLDVTVSPGLISSFLLDDCGKVFSRRPIAGAICNFWWRWWRQHRRRR